MSLVAGVRRYFASREDRVMQAEKARKRRRYIKENRWEGLVPGDVVEYRGRLYRYHALRPGRYPRVIEKGVFYLIHPAKHWEGEIELGYGDRYLINRVGHLQPEIWEKMEREASTAMQS